MIFLGCDHGGFRLKTAIRSYLEEQGIAYQDVGCYNTESVDYPHYAWQVANAVAKGTAKAGILICTTGLGVSMAANKVKGVRAAVCTNAYTAEMTRRHNDANVLCMGEQVVEEALALEITRIFLQTAFEGGKHARRIGLLADIELGKMTEEQGKE